MNILIIRKFYVQKTHSQRINLHAQSHFKVYTLVKVKKIPQHYENHRNSDTIAQYIKHSANENDDNTIMINDDNIKSARTTPNIKLAYFHHKHIHTHTRTHTIQQD